MTTDYPALAHHHLACVAEAQDLLDNPPPHAHPDRSKLETFISYHRDLASRWESKAKQAKERKNGRN